MSSKDKHIEERIQAYLDGKLSTEEIDQLWSDIIKNPEYYDHLQINAELKELFEKRRGKKSDSSATVHQLNPMQKYGKWVMALAAVILLTIAINLFQVSDHPDMITAIDQISMLEMETVDVTRDQAVELTGADSLLFYAYDASVRNNYEEAAELYRDISRRFPESVEAAKARLNQGILTYNNRDYEEAMTYFLASLEIGHSDMYVVEKAHWYLANTYINMDRLEDARREAYEVYAHNGVYRNAAYHMIRQLNIELGFDEVDPELSR